jgi:integrase
MPLRAGMTDTRYLKKQRFKDAEGKWRDGHSWYFVMAIPSALRGKFVSQGRNGKPAKPLTKIVEKLGTQSLSEAQEKRWPLVHQWREAFKRTLTGEPLSPAEIDAEAREIYTSTLQRLEAEAKARKSSVTKQLEDLEGDLGIAFFPRYEDAENWQDILEATTDFEFVAHHIAAVERRKGVTIEPGTTYQLLAKAIVRANVWALEGRIRALKGQPSEPPISFLGSAGIDPVTLRPIAPVRRAQIRIRDDDEGMRFSEAASLYIDQMQRDVHAKLTEQTRRQSEGVFDLFKNFTDDAPLASITKSTAANFLDLVGKLDPHWNQVEGARKMPLAQLAERCASRPGKLSNRTINRYISSLSSVFKFADKRSDVDVHNPFRGQMRKQAKGTGWRGYRVGELNKLFGSELFTGTTAAERIRPNEQTFKTAMLWVPLIALYSGMRSNEICQLHVSDIIRKDKVWAFRVSDEGEGQSVKTQAAVRIVPVHSELVRCGFLDYVKTLPPGQLFPALKPGGVDGRLNWYFSKRFTAYRRRCGVPDGERLSFHSFRKNAAQTLKDKRATQAEIAELIGHEQGFTNKFYTPLQLPMPALKELIERVGYPGLNLTHLHVE